jgi:hypothetical protein
MSAAAERLRQEAETFDLQKAHADRWFAWRLVANYVALGLLLVVAGVCIWILATSDHRSATVVRWATGALGTDIVGFVITVVRAGIIATSAPKLAPVTPAAHRPPRPRAGA